MEGPIEYQFEKAALLQEAANKGLSMTVFWRSTDAFSEGCRSGEVDPSVAINHAWLQH